MLRVGDTAPDFTLPATGANRTVTLSQATAGGPVVLHFFPFAFTGG